MKSMDLRPVSIPIQTLRRLPYYLNYLKGLKEGDRQTISATIIAEELDLNQVQVRKDLAHVCKKGKPKIGYLVKELIYDIENQLGYYNTNSAALIGVGNLGRALLSYNGFDNYGLTIAAAFDVDRSIIGREIDGKMVFPLEKLENMCKRLGIHMGIITVPANAAQEVCDLLIQSGVLAIWNFAPVRLTVSEGVLIQNENMAGSLASLSKHLSDRLAQADQPIS